MVKANLLRNVAISLTAVVAGSSMQVQSHKSFLPSNETVLGPRKMSSLTASCPETNDAIITEASIAVVMIASKAEIELNGTYHQQHEIFTRYCELHGYLCQTVDPAVVMESHGTLHDHGGFRNILICSKPLVMLYTMRSIISEYGCKANWIVFLDMDITILDLSRRLTSIILHANTHANTVNYSKACDFIAQDAPTTINSGVLFFRLSASGEAILQQWVDAVVIHHKQKIFWQQDQGWLQYVFLKYVQELTKKMPLFNCAVNGISNIAATTSGSVRFGESAVRSLCYAKMLSYYGLHPGQRSFGKFCLLPGVTELDRINLKDWPGIQKWSHDELVHIMHLPYVSNVEGQCHLRGLFLYHGKNPAVLQLIHHHRQITLKNKTTLRNAVRTEKSGDIEAGEHPTTVPWRGQGRDNKSASSVSSSTSAQCTREILAQFVASADDERWLPEKWKALTAAARPPVHKNDVSKAREAARHHNSVHKLRSQ